jgi:hypothetical protein
MPTQRPCNKRPVDTWAVRPARTRSRFRSRPKYGRSCRNIKRLPSPLRSRLIEYVPPRTKSCGDPAQSRGRQEFRATLDKPECAALLKCYCLKLEDAVCAGRGHEDNSLLPIVARWRLIARQNISYWKYQSSLSLIHNNA